MRLKRLWVLAVAGAAGMVLSSTPARAESPERPEIFPLSQVKRGQKGYGLTTMAGTKPTPFEFEVLGISRNFIPKIDVILVKSDDPKLQHSGFWQGMSGSPLFIEGKLACAFAYGWRFARSPVGGCTPIQYMREDAATPRRHHDWAGPRGGSAKPTASGRRKVQPSSRGSWSEWTAIAPEHTAESALSGRNGPRTPWLLDGPLPSANHASKSADDNLVQAAVPIAMAGFSAPAFAQAKAIMQGFPIEPMRAGGGTGNATEGPSEFALGQSIGVQLLRGDMAGTGTCTVSWVEGSQVLACGHPMFGAGELYAPVTSSEVHLVMASEMSSFVVASPMRELGALVQDRQSMIMADTGLETSMVPVDVRVKSSNGTKTVTRGFHVEVLNNKFFTGPFAGVVAMNAINRFVPDRDDATVLMESTVHIKGKPPLHFVDYLYGENGVGDVISGARGLRVLVPLLNNPFEPVVIERVELEARVDYSTNFGELQSLRLPSAELAPGKRAYVEVRMTTYDGKDVVEKVPFDVPAELAGSIVKMTVTAGDGAGVDAAPPKDLDGLLDAFRRLLPGNVIAVVLYSADEGAAMHGKLVKDLPPSAVDRLRMKAGTDRAATYRPASRSAYPTKRVINGSQSMLVKIAAQ